MEPSKYAKTRLAATIHLGVAEARMFDTVKAIKDASAELHLGVSLKSCTYICNGIFEDGIEIGLLDYPGGPGLTLNTILGLAKRLLEPAGQRAASVTCRIMPTYLISAEDDQWQY